MTMQRPATRAPIGLALLASACIIPDRDIQVYSTRQNDNAVRFVAGIPLSVEAGEDCDEDTKECPLPAQSPLPTYLDETQEEYQFCICDEDRIDTKRLRQFSLLAEDPDEDDQVFAVALLDWNPVDGDSAQDYVAYRSYVDPNNPLVLVPDYESAIIGRPRPFTRELLLRKSPTDRTVDLCNGAGTVVGPGLHTITFMVSDRTWFQGVDGLQQDGVPDIAAGATYDLQSFVFHCYTEGDVDQCDCENIEG